MTTDNPTNIDKKSELFKLSVSKSSTFNGCKKKYQFSYIMKLPKKEYSFHTFGRFAHRILELFHLKYLEGVAEPYGKVMGQAFAESMEEFKGKITPEFKTEAEQIMRSYLKQIKDNPNSVQSVKSVEKVFNIHINELVILTGMIDRVQLDSDGIWHVVDYKTSKSSKYLKNDTLQLLTYAYILYMENPEIKKVRVSYIMLKQNCEWITKEFDLEEILTIKNTYATYAHNMRNEKEFPANPTPLCGFCEFSNLCEPGFNLVAKNIKHGSIGWGKSKPYQNYKKDK